MSERVRVRVARARDHQAVAAVLDSWWGRPVLPVLPRLFLEHFWSTSLVAEDDRGLAAFLVGVVSPSQPEGAYVHVLGVRPDLRGTGLARDLHARFADVARDRGCAEVRAVTVPGNSASIAAHRALGFEVSGPVESYDGPGHPEVTFRRPL